jgi:hypothetical protein
MENTMTNHQRLQYFKVALAILDIHFENEKTYISILSAVDLIDKKEGKTTIDDTLSKNAQYQMNYDFSKIAEDMLSKSILP